MTCIYCGEAVRHRHDCPVMRRGKSFTTLTITEDFFNTIELHEAPPHVEGNVLHLRGRTVERRRDGTVVRDETRDTGVCILNWEECAHMFGVQPPRRSWWERLARWLRGEGNQ